jgi:hypothetical protein
MKENTNRKLEIKIKSKRNVRPTADVLIPPRNDLESVFSYLVS